MRYIKASILLSAISFLFTSFGYSQTDNQVATDTTGINVIKTEYTRLDEISKTYNPFFGNSVAQIDFILVELKNLSTEQQLYGVEILIERTDTEVVSSSISFSNLGSLWGLNASATAVNLSKEGYILLLKDDLVIIVDFLNDIIGRMGIGQENYKAYSLSLYDRFELGMLYDNRWYFTIKIDNAAYRLDYQNGFEMLRELNSFKNYIVENS